LANRGRSESVTLLYSKRTIHPEGSPATDFFILYLAILQARSLHQLCTVSLCSHRENSVRASSHKAYVFANPLEWPFCLNFALVAPARGEKPTQETQGWEASMQFEGHHHCSYPFSSSAVTSFSEAMHEDPEKIEAHPTRPSASVSINRPAEVPSLPLMLLLWARGTILWAFDSGSGILNTSSFSMLSDDITSKGGIGGCGSGALEGQELPTGQGQSSGNSLRNFWREARATSTDIGPGSSSDSCAQKLRTSRTAWALLRSPIGIPR
jgi:hypothetical protein